MRFGFLFFFFRFDVQNWVYAKVFICLSTDFGHCLWLMNTLSGNKNLFSYFPQSQQWRRRKRRKWISPGSRSTPWTRIGRIRKMVLAVPPRFGDSRCTIQGLRGTAKERFWSMSFSLRSCLAPEFNPTAVGLVSTNMPQIQMHLCEHKH